MQVINRGFGTVMVWGVLALILVAGSVYYVSQQDGEDVAMMEKEIDSIMEDKDAAMAEKEDGAMMDKEENTMMDKGGEVVEGDATMKKSGTYQEYSASKIALAEKDKVVLFFHADWCPICRGIESEINKDISLIPAGVHILKVDYDQEIALRQKYGVTVQHSFVQVDSQGTSIGKWSNETTLSGVLSRIK